MLRCSSIACTIFHPLFFMIRYVSKMIAKNHRPIFMITQVLSGKTTIGIINVKANISLEKNVAIVDFRTILSLLFFFDSSERWMPSASEKASATAIVSIHPITTISDHVHDVKPTINHKVVIIPEVIPKLIHVLIDCFIYIGNTMLNTYHMVLFSHKNYVHMSLS